MQTIIDIIGWVATMVLVVMGANAIIVTLVLTLGTPAVTIIKGEDAS